MKTFKNTVAAYCGITAVLLLGFAVLCGCTGAAGDVDNKSVQQEIGVVDNLEEDNLDAETEWQIRQDYFYRYRPIISDVKYSNTIDDVQVRHYFGTYNGCVVVRMSPGLPGTQISVFNPFKLEVADSFFLFSAPLIRIFVWKQGGNAASGELYKPQNTQDLWYEDIDINKKVRNAHNAGKLSFYELRDAYDLGLLTAEDVQSIADRYGDFYWGEKRPAPWGGKMPVTVKEAEEQEWYRGVRPLSRYPTIFTPEELEQMEVYFSTTDGLDAETERQLRRDYLYRYLPIFNRHGYDIYDVKVERYLGTYQGYVAVMMGPGLFWDYGTAEDMCKLEVAGTFFDIGGPRERIFVWKPGENTETYKVQNRVGEWEDIVNERVRDAHNAGLLPFYDLRDAYDLGMVTAEDVKSMAEGFIMPDRFYDEGKKSPEDYERYGWSLLDRSPTIFTPEELSK